MLNLHKLLSFANACIQQNIKRNKNLEQFEFWTMEYGVANHVERAKNAFRLDYPNIQSPLRPVPHGEGLIIQSPLRPVPHGEGLQIPTQPLHWKDNNILQRSDIEDTYDENMDISEKIYDPTFRPETASEPHFIHQKELHGLVCELGLSKQQAELLGSRM
ncbi:hypothetical protein AVEN_24502-1 [Araneus ventricosus]|uniref:Uncharacterized protein n=1 Tax=Araneus ventricosus TaxID=182803 RepID=A0A4Y2QCF5_ARAVE|nr:hypothetical protein AVEN_24502-1 [Araneus ventricosus]